MDKNAIGWQDLGMVKSGCAIAFYLAAIPVSLMSEPGIRPDYITVTCHGQFVNPGRFQVERGTTLLQLLYFTGGLIYCDEVQVISVNEAGEKYTLTIDVGKLCEADGSDFTLQDESVLWVGEHFLGCTGPAIINPLITGYMQRHYPGFRIIREMPTESR